MTGIDKSSLFLKEYSMFSRSIKTYKKNDIFFIDFKSNVNHIDCWNFCKIPTRFNPDAQ